jgi:hypothetical protein
MWWLLAAALAAPPPGVDTEDIDVWAAAADQLLDGPAGCWEVVGRADWNHDGGRIGFTRGSAVFAGRMEEGVWSEYHIESLGEVYREFREDEQHTYRAEQLFVPLMGRHAEGDDEEEGGETAIEGGAGPVNVLTDVLSELRGSAEYAWAAWDEDASAVVFTRVVPIGKRTNAPEVTMNVVFPEGEVVPERAEVVFPERFWINNVPPVVIRDARVELRGQRWGDTVFPAAEAFSAELRVLGFRLTSAQTIRYRSVRPCPE